MPGAEKAETPLHAQEPPASALRYHGGRYALVLEMPSWAMAKAYFDWVTSGEAHDAFGLWAGRQDLE
jgi:hypothetical protein